MLSMAYESARDDVIWSLDLTDAQIHFKNYSPVIDTGAIVAMAESGSSILPWNRSVTDYSR
jgi:hypothetical protein